MPVFGCAWSVIFKAIESIQRLFPPSHWDGKQESLWLESSVRSESPGGRKGRRSGACPEHGWEASRACGAHAHWVIGAWEAAAAGTGKGAVWLMKATWIRLLKRAKGGRLKNSDICVSFRAFCTGRRYFVVVLSLVQVRLSGAPVISNMMLIARAGAEESPLIPSAPFPWWFIALELPPGQVFSP